MKEALEQLKDVIAQSDLLDTRNEVEELAALIYQKVAENLFIDNWGQGGSGQLETVVSPEILCAIEYGYRQCEKGKSLQETLENARG